MSNKKPKRPNGNVHLSLSACDDVSLQEKSPSKGNAKKEKISFRAEQPDRKSKVQPLDRVRAGQQHQERRRRSNGDFGNVHYSRGTRDHGRQYNRWPETSTKDTSAHRGRQPKQRQNGLEDPMMREISRAATASPNTDTIDLCKSDEEQEKGRSPSHQERDVSPAAAASSSSQAIDLASGDDSTDEGKETASISRKKPAGQKNGENVDGATDSMVAFSCPSTNTNRKRKRKAKNRSAKKPSPPNYQHLNSSREESPPTVEDLSKDDDEPKEATAKLGRTPQNGSRSSSRRKSADHVDLSAEDDDDETSKTKGKDRNGGRSSWDKAASAYKQLKDKAGQVVRRTITSSTGGIMVPALKKVSTFRSRAAPRDEISEYSSEEEGRKPRATNAAPDNSRELMSKVKNLEKAPINEDDYNRRHQLYQRQSRLQSSRNTTNNVSTPPAWRSEKDSGSGLSFSKVNNPRTRRTSSQDKKRKKPNKIVPGRSLEPEMQASKRDSDRLRRESEDEPAKKRRRTPRTYASNDRGYSGSEEWLPSRRTTRSQSLSQEKKKKRGPPEMIEILSSDDESPKPEPVSEFQLTCIGVLTGERLRILHEGCSLKYDKENRKVEVSHTTRRRKKSIKIDVDHIGKWFSISENVDSSQDSDVCDFLTMQVDALVELRLWDTKDEIRTLFCKFETFDLQDFKEILRDSEVEPENMPTETLDSNVAYLADMNEAIRKKRSAVTPSKKKANFLKGKKEDDILLVYPFTEDRNILDKAAEGLPDFFVESIDESQVSGASSEDQGATSGGRQRSHAVTIRVQDYERLEPLTWLNDSLVDFFMLWISRGMENVQTADVHFFTSHFYSTLTKKDGPSAVTSWTARKNIDIFKKKLIFIPINKTMHWSLCVVVNPGEIEDYELGERPHDKMPCLLFFDSLRMHNVYHARTKIVAWLNSEWQRLRQPEVEPFTSSNLKCYSPKAPQQDNGSDCGVFVCRFALAMYKLRHLDFTETQVFPEGVPPKKRGQPAFKQAISNTEGFNFDVDDILTMREDFQKLIKNLSGAYQRVLKEKKAVAAAVKKEGSKSDANDNVSAGKTDDDTKEPFTNRPTELREQNHELAGKIPPPTGKENQEDDQVDCMNYQPSGFDDSHLLRDDIPEQADTATNDDEAIAEVTGKMEELCSDPPQAADHSTEVLDSNVAHSCGDSQGSASIVF